MSEDQKVEILLHRPLIRTVEEYWNFIEVCRIVGPIMQWIIANRFSDERKAQAQFVLDFLKEILAEENKDGSDS